MKFEPSTEKSSVAIHAFLVLAAAVVFTKVIWNIDVIFNGIKMILGFIQPVLFGFIIAFLLNPLLQKIENQVIPKLLRKTMSQHKKRTIALFFTYLTFFVVFGGFIWLVMPQLVHSLSELVKKIPDYAYNSKSVFNGIIDSLKHNQSTLTSSQELATLYSKLSQSLSELMSKASSLVGALLGGLIGGVAGFTSNIVQVGLGFIISLYFLTSKELMFAQLKKLGYAIFSEKTVKVLESIFVDSAKIFSSYVVGAIVDASIVGIICSVFLFISGFFVQGLWQYAILIGVIIGITNVIPYVGPFLGAVPATLLLLTVNPWFALIFIAFILVLQQVDGNIINPKIVGSSVGLPALWVIFSLMLFGGLFGIVGMLIGVPLFGVIYMLVGRFANFLLQKKNLSTETKDYFSKKS